MEADQNLNLMSLPQEEQLQTILNYKKEGNNFISSNQYEEALKVYKKLAEAIENLFKSVNESSEAENFKKTDTFKEINNQYKLIISNTALCLSKLGNLKDSVKCDIKIFQKLDRNFDKSYARLINNYLDLGNFTMANYFGSLMRHNFDTNTNKKYSDILQRLEKERGKHQKDLGQILAGMK